MIEVKGPRFQRAYIMFMIAFYILWSSVLVFAMIFNIGTVYYENMPIFFLVMTFAAFFLGGFYHFYNNIITRVVIEEDHYRLTKLDKKEIVITSDQVSRILHSDRRYVMVLNNQKRYTFYKSYGIKSLIDYSVFDPWAPLMTKERFPNAEFGSLPLM